MDNVKKSKTQLMKEMRAAEDSRKKFKKAQENDIINNEKSSDINIDINNIEASFENSVKDYEYDTEKILKKAEVSSVENKNIINRELEEKLQLLRQQRENIEKGLNLTIEVQARTLINKYDDIFNSLKGKIEYAESKLELEEINSNAKLVRKLWQDKLEELQNEKEKFENNLEKELGKISSKKSKKEESIDKDYITSQVGIRAEFKVKELKNELDSKIQEVEKFTLEPKRKHESALVELKRLTKEFNEQKDKIIDDCEDELKQEIKMNKENKDFNRKKVCIPEEKREEISKLLDKGFIYEDVLAEFKTLSDKEILENEIENKKSRLIEDKYKVYKKLIEEQEKIIKENKEILNTAEVDKKVIVEEFNKKVTDLNKTLDSIADEKEIKVPKIDKIKLDDAVSKDNNVKFEIEKNKKYIDMEQKYNKKPKKEGLISKIVNRLKDTQLYKSHEAKKQVIKEEKERLEKEKVAKYKVSMNEQKKSIDSFKNNLGSMVESTLGINSEFNSNSKEVEYTEIEI